METNNRKDPEPGYGVKELFFTQNEEAYFAIMPQWKQDIIIRNFKPSKAAMMTLLATGEILKGQQNGKDFLITMPPYQPNKMRDSDNYAYVVKINKI